MGQDPAEIQREIAARRSQITAHLQDVEDRIRDDVQSLRSNAQEQASSAVNETKSKIDLTGQTREHPLTMLAGALGLGVVLGAASEGLTDGGSSQPDRGGQSNSSQSSDGGSGGGAINSLLMTFLGPASQTVRDELQELVREGFSTFRESTGLNQNSSNASADGDPARAA